MSEPGRAHRADRRARRHRAWLRRRVRPLGLFAARHQGRRSSPASGSLVATEEEARESLAAVERMHERARAARFCRSRRTARRKFRCAAPRASSASAGVSPTRAAGCGRATAPPRGRRPRCCPRLRRAITAWSSRQRRARAESTVIAAPPRCWEPRELSEGARDWGVAAQLYAFRSARNLGIGNYADAGEAARAAGGARRLVPRPQPGACALRRRPHEDLALFALLAAVPRDAAHRPDRGRRASRAARRRGFSRRRGRASTRCARRSSSIMPASGMCCARCSRRCGSTSRPAAATSASRASAVPWGRRSRTTQPSRHCPSSSAPKVRLGSATGPRPSATPVRRRCGASSADQAERVGFHAWLQWLADRQLETASQRARARRHGARPLSRPRGRRRSRRLGGLVAPERFGTRPLDRRAAGPARAAGPGLGPAALQPDRARPRGARRLPRARGGEHAPRRRGAHRPRLPARSACS